MEIKSYEIVVARYNEDISWLLNVNKKWKITIYNKGLPFEKIGSIKMRNPNIDIINIENKGREAETYVYHMLHRYNNYADLTVFIQADPFTHAPEMKELLEVLANKTTLDPATEKYIPMTICYDLAKNVPPREICEQRQNRFFRVEDISPYTLDCLVYIDQPVHYFGYEYRKIYNKPITTNIIKDFFEQIGIDHKYTNIDKYLQFNYAACFAVPKYSLMQYDKDVYERMYTKTFSNKIMPWIFERSWLTIFDSTFDSSNILADYKK